MVQICLCEKVGKIKKKGVYFPLLMYWSAINTTHTMNNIIPATNNTVPITSGTYGIKGSATPRIINTIARISKPSLYIWLCFLCCRCSRYCACNTSSHIIYTYDCDECRYIDYQQCCLVYCCLY